MLKIVGKLLICIFVKCFISINVLYIYEERVINWELVFFGEVGILSGRNDIKNFKK